MTPRQRTTTRRQPVHTRQNRVSGSGNLNQKALQVLAAVKFSPTSLSREDIKDKTPLSLEDIEHQVKLLARIHLLSFHSRFPPYPQQGWRVYTKAEDHMKITNLLSSHGIHDPRVEETRRILGDYYPTGMELEGLGVQPDRHSTYPRGHPIIPELDFRPETIAVMVKFRDEKKPFKPKEYSESAVEEKKEKWRWFVKEMSRVYQIPEPSVTFGPFTSDSWNRSGSSFSSLYNRSTNTLYFVGKFSLVTLLHEFGHARGFDERDTVIWYMNLGLRTFPITFNRLLSTSDPTSHTLVQSNTNMIYEGSEGE